ncbi:hypothetical protein ACLOJK_003227 [Asimina triloba]
MPAEKAAAVKQVEMNAAELAGTDAEKMRIRITSSNSELCTFVHCADDKSLARTVRRDRRLRREATSNGRPGSTPRRRSSAGAWVSSGHSSPPGGRLFLVHPSIRPLQWPAGTNPAAEAMESPPKSFLSLMESKQKQSQSQSLPVLMPGDEIPKEKLIQSYRIWSTGEPPAAAAAAAAAFKVAVDCFLHLFLVFVPGKIVPPVRFTFNFLRQAH